MLMQICIARGGRDGIVIKAHIVLLIEPSGSPAYYNSAWYYLLDHLHSQWWFANFLL